MKKIYLYAGIGAWIFLMFVIVVSLIPDSSDDISEESDFLMQKTVDMNEIVVHPIFDDHRIAITITEASMVLDQITPQYCLLGECIDERDPGMYVLTVHAEITNLDEDDYVYTSGIFQVEDDGGKRYSDSGIDLSSRKFSKGETFKTRISFDVEPPSFRKYDLIISQNWSDKETIVHLNQLQKLRSSMCQGDARCMGGFITNVVDGDTLDFIDVETQTEQRIRLALVDTPEKGESLFDTATDFTAGFCPVDSYILFDEDDNQTEGSFGRIIGKLYCEGELLNEKLLEHELAVIDTRFCNVSEYSTESWVQKYGCS